MNKKLIAMLYTLSLCVNITACSNNTNSSKTSIDIKSLENENISTIDTYIKLGAETTIEGEGATISNNKITITNGGTYSLSGKIDDGQIIVDAGKEDKVYIILNGADINCSNSAPIYVKNAKKAILSLEDGTENNITDGENYVLENPSNNEPNAAIFSNDDMTIIGDGKLTVNANYNNGIATDDNLKIQSGTIAVNAKNNGIKGKDCINITDGDITITSKGDGMQSDNTKDDSKGYIYIEGGKINIDAEEDGIQAETRLLVSDGDITIKTGDGSENSTKADTDLGQIPQDMINGQKPQMPQGMINGKRPEMPQGIQNGEFPSMPNSGISKGEIPQLPNGQEKPPQMLENIQKPQNSKDTTTKENAETTSRKGLKASKDILIDGGNFNINSQEDSIHSNTNISINGGNFEIASGDDGIHSDTKLDINRGTINISTSYEGIESTTININDGNIHIVSSDDGVNSAGGNDVSTETGMAGNDKFNTLSNGLININGGYLYVDASGDGIDANGNIKMSGGTVLVNGPVNDGNGTLDYDGTFDISGGILVTAGSSGMAQAPSYSSTQNILNINLTQQKANTVVNIKSSKGKDILTYAPSKNYSSVIISTPDIDNNSEYTVSIGGLAKGEAKDGLYSNGNYSGGTNIGSEIISSTVTNIIQEGASTNTMGIPGKRGQYGKGEDTWKRIERPDKNNSNLNNLEITQQ